MGNEKYSAGSSKAPSLSHKALRTLPAEAEGVSQPSDRTAPKNSHHGPTLKSLCIPAQRFAL